MLIAKQPQPLLRPIVTKAIAWLCDSADQQAFSEVGHSSAPEVWSTSLRDE